MKITEALVARNEEWIIGFSARSVLAWVDELIVMVHASTDQTLDILRAIQHEVGDRLVIIEQPDPEWMQYEYRQSLLELARGRSATHIAFLDADEALTANLLPEIRGYIGSLGPGGCLTLPVPCMWRSPTQYRAGEFRYAHDKLTVAFADSPEVAWVARGGYQHDQRQPYGLSGYRHVSAAGGVMHFQWADWRRARAKHALYKIEHMVKWPERQSAQEIDSLHNGVLDESGLDLREAPREWLGGYQNIFPCLRMGVVPWQEAECRRLWVEHGPARFAGLDLFGLEEAHGDC